MSVDPFISTILQYKWTILFYTAVVLLVYFNRNKFDFQGKFIALYRTKIGIKLMDTVSTKAGKLVRGLGYIGIVVGFAGMLVTFGLIAYLTYQLIAKVPGATGASPVIPGLPIAGTGLVFPLVTGWIALFIIMIVHEFAHGVVSKSHDVKVKHSGIAFFGPILGAFVEPDEKKLLKKKDSVQHSVFAAGSFSNLLLYVLIMFAIIPLLLPVAQSLVYSTGVIISPQPGFPADEAGLGNFTNINLINGNEVLDIDEFQKAIEDIEIGNTVTLSNENETFSIVTTENPDEPGKAYLGIWLHGNNNILKNDDIISTSLYKSLNWILNLLVWTAFLTFNIGLINLLPIFITDGARMLKIILDRYIKNKKLSMSIWMNLNWLCVLLILILLFLPLLRWINENFFMLFFNF